MLAFRFRVVTVPLLYCLRGTETMCKLFLAATVVNGGSQSAAGAKSVHAQ